MTLADFCENYASQIAIISSFCGACDVHYSSLLYQQLVHQLLMSPTIDSYYKLRGNVTKFSVVIKQNCEYYLLFF